MLSLTTAEKERAKSPAPAPEGELAMPSATSNERQALLRASKSQREHIFEALQGLNVDDLAVGFFRHAGHVSAW